MMEIFFIYLIPIYFIVGWAIVCRYLRKKMCLVNQLDLDKGALVKNAGWGSGSINGVYVKNGLKVEAYQNGYLVKLIFLFGGGVVWIPKDDFEVVSRKEENFFLPFTIEVRSQSNFFKFLNSHAKLFT